MSTYTNVRFEGWKTGKLGDPGVRAAYDKLKLAYQVIPDVLVYRKDYAPL